MKIVITTQYMENYGAHDWDGEGKCPQYWKSKGGDIYVIENLTQAQAEDFLENKIQKLYELIEYSNEGSKEFVIGTSIAEDTTVIHDEWETPNIIKVENDIFTVSRITKNDEYGYLNQKISEKKEMYVMTAGGGRDNYKVDYLLKTGELVNSENIMSFLK